MTLTLSLRPDVTVLAVPVEMNAHGFAIIGNVTLAYDYKGYTKKSLLLPPGSYELIGLLREVTEEVAKPLVQEELNGGYREYSSWTATGGLGLNCDTAFDSLKSAIHSAGGDPKRNYLLIKKIN